MLKASTPTPDAALERNEILLVDDDLPTLQALTRVLEDEQYVVKAATNGEDAIRLARAATPDIALLDLGLPDIDGVDLLRNLLEEGVKHVIIVSGNKSVETTRACLRSGAYDFILKPASREELLQAVRRASSLYSISRITAQHYPLELQIGFGALETPSPASQQLFNQLRQASLTPRASSLVTGPAGLFKRDIAALAHHFSKRPGPALLINCALETDAMALARFTHQGSTADNSGSDTDRSDKPNDATDTGSSSSDTPSDTSRQRHGGYIEQARGGTLVLEDLALLPQAVQHWLIDYLEKTNSEKNNTDQALINWPCNIIGILKEPAQQAMDDGRLLPELHAHLSANHYELTALRDRPEDVRVYAQHAVAQLNALLNSEKSLSPDFLTFLTKQAWDGNLIELKNRLLIAYRGTEDGEEIVHDPHLWPPLIHESSERSGHGSDVTGAVGTRLLDAENQLIEATLKSVSNNKSQAAKILGISVKTLYNRLKK